jgi:predicted small secreted protein
LNWKSFIIGLGSGLVGGFLATKMIDHYSTISPEKVLEKVKDVFKEQGPISGSWIHMKAERYVRDELDYQVFKGGITKLINGDTEQYEFIADATTGTILSIQKP